MPLPGFPKIKTPKIESVLSIIDTASGAIDKGLDLIDKVGNKFDKLGISDTPSATPPRVAESQKEEPKTEPPASSPHQSGEEIATACVPCALGHFSTSAGLLNEAVRFKREGISSNEILDRIAKCLQEQNALERVDLAPEMLQNTTPWEKGLVEEALQQSRALRHKLERIKSIDELEQVAADAASYYRELNREWYKGRFSHLGKEKVEAIEKRLSSEANAEAK
ncbi:hypothetical protein ES708_10204 [subsurface metagenome]